MDFLQTISTYFVRYGYFVVFVGVLGENAGLPVPGETTLLAAGFFASQGHFVLPVVMGVAALGAIVGTAPLSRAEMTKRVWAYIKQHALQDAQDRRQIKADATLKGRVPSEEGVSKVLICYPRYEDERQRNSNTRECSHGSSSPSLLLLSRHGYCAPWHDAARQATVSLSAVPRRARAHISPGR